MYYHIPIDQKADFDFGEIKSRSLQGCTPLWRLQGTIYLQLLDDAYFPWSVALFFYLQSQHNRLSPAQADHSDLHFFLPLQLLRTSNYTVLSCVKLLQSCPTLCNPTDCSLPDSSSLGILQARIPERIAMPSSRGSFRPRDWTHRSYISCIHRQVLYQQQPPK